MKDQDKNIAVSSTEKNHLNNDVFESKNDHNFIIKKTEKIASATYLVTGLLSDSEPMKWSLRSKVADLVSYVSKYPNIRQTEYVLFSNSVKTRILEIISLLEVSNLGGLVSSMNFEVLKNEFNSLIEVILNNKHKTDISNTLISNNFFDTSDSSGGRVSSLPSIANPAHVKDTLSVKDSNVFKSNNRQNIILGLLKKKKDLTIKDISGIIKDVSEKTIQRELISLINSGVIIKTGERRWSKYSLNNVN